MYCTLLLIRAACYVPQFILFFYLFISSIYWQGLICLIAYYFLAETWFAVLFTVIVEIVEPEVR